MTDDSQTTTGGRSIWAWVPALLLGTMLVGLGSMAYVAIDDPHFALEPDYYDKAVHWDRSQAEARASAKTGLELQLNGPLVTTGDGSVEIEVHVTDRRTSPFTGAQVELQAFPNAYADRIQTLSLRETAPGVYAGRLTRSVLGLWELRFGVARETVRFREVRRVDVAKGGAA
jgi:hypothetical protein